MMPKTEYTKRLHAACASSDICLADFGAKIHYTFSVSQMSQLKERIKVISYAFVRRSRKQNVEHSNEVVNVGSYPQCLGL